MILADELVRQLTILRLQAEETNDQHIMAGAYTLLSLLGHATLDMTKAVELIKESKDGPRQKAMYLTMVARAYAELGNMGMARRVAYMTSKFSDGWYADAIMQVALFSSDKEDLNVAHSVAKVRVKCPHRQGELMADMRLADALFGTERARTVDQEMRFSGLPALNEALQNLNNLAAEQVAVPDMTGIEARLMVESEMSRCLALAMK